MSFPVLLRIARSAENPHRSSASYVPSVHVRAETESGGHPSRYDMSGKSTVVISTCGFYTAQGNYDCVTSLYDRLCGKGGYTAIFCGQGELFRVKELSNALTNIFLG